MNCFVETNEKGVKQNQFSSLNNHLGIKPSKKDDQESLGYILIYFLKKGNLFGDGQKNKNLVAKVKQLEKLKLELIPDLFCQGLPKGIVTYMNIVKNLKCYERPDYSHLKSIFMGELRKMVPNENIKSVYYDWIIKAVMLATPKTAPLKKKTSAESHMAESLYLAESKEANDEANSLLGIEISNEMANIKIEIPKEAEGQEVGHEEGLEVGQERGHEEDQVDDQDSHSCNLDHSMTSEILVSDSNDHKDSLDFIKEKLINPSL